MLKVACKTLGIEFNLKNLFTEAKLQRNVESYLYDIFHPYDKDKKLFFLIYLVLDS